MFGVIVQQGAGGWLLFTAWGQGTDVVARVRFEARGDGRLVPAEVYVENSEPGGGFSGDILRTLPLGSMVAWANGRGRSELVHSIETDAKRIDRATDRWLRAVGNGHRDITLDLGIETKQELPRSFARLYMPEGRKYPDEFYERLAAIYTTLAQGGSRSPAKDIADANGEDVTESKVHRWIKEARRRGMLVAGRRGKADST